MENNRVNLNELKNDIVRCIIPFKNINGDEQQIEVYNIIGDRRLQMLEELSKIVDCKEDEIISANDSYYKTLIMEFTDIKADETDINDIVVNPSLEFQILIHELDEMVYELQYEVLCKNINNSRRLMLEEMNKQLTNELENLERFVSNSSDMMKAIGVEENDI
ncbi:MAG: hypothetical protein ACRCWM_08090 [Sarcina sp.]|uniref:hypothetical protein n=1 Tax=Clostridium sp. TaxID=1506 RepID=UPI003EE6029A